MQFFFGEFQMVNSSKHGKVASQGQRMLPPEEISNIQSGTNSDPTDATFESLPMQSFCQSQWINKMLDLRMGLLKHEAM